MIEANKKVASCTIEGTATIEGSVKNVSLRVKSGLTVGTKLRLRRAGLGNETGSLLVLDKPLEIVPWEDVATDVSRQYDNGSFLCGDDSFELKGGLTGGGFFRIWDKCAYLTGDNGGFEGELNCANNGFVTFVGSNSSLPRAIYTNADKGKNVTTRFAASTTDATFTFGSINTDKNMQFPSDAAYTIQFGALGGESTISSDVFRKSTYTSEQLAMTPSNFDLDENWQDGAPDVTFKKCGSGTLNFGTGKSCKLELSKGTTKVAKETTINSLTVMDGATLDMVNGRSLTTAAATFDDGAILMVTLAFDTTDTTDGLKAVAMPTVNGSVNVSGLHIVVSNPELINDVMNGTDETLKNLVSKTRVNVLGATVATGTATLDTTFVPPESTQWTLKSKAGGVWLGAYGKGLLIVIK